MLCILYCIVFAMECAVLQGLTAAGAAAPGVDVAGVEPWKREGAEGRREGPEPSGAAVTKGSSLGLPTAGGEVAGTSFTINITKLF